VARNSVPCDNLKTKIVGKTFKIMINVRIFINSINQLIGHLGNYACQNMVAMVIYSDRQFDIMHLILIPGKRVCFVFPRILLFSRDELIHL